MSMRQARWAVVVGRRAFLVLAVQLAGDRQA